MGVIFKNNVMYGAGDIEISPVIYSEEEREIGVWTDGKPLYQTTIHTGALIKDGNWHSIAHNIPNIDKIILCTGTVYAIDNTAYPMPNYRPIYSMGICLDATTTNIEYIQNWLDTSPDSYVTLQYTKTIDQPGSGTWTPSGVPAMHYSTDEQVVGTWIDGKTIYEQTIVGNAISDTGINVLWERTDIDTIVEYNCIFLDDSNLEYNANYYYSTGAYFRAFVNTRNVWTNTKGIVCQRSSNQLVNGTRLTVRYTKSTS